ncbi:MAG: thioredoxin family protein [Bacilli bacterium]
MKKFKKFVKKNISYIVIGALLVVFLGFIFIFGSGGKTVESSTNVKEWLTNTKSDVYVVTVLAQTSCPHCIAYKPMIEEVKKSNDFKLYWFEMDTISNSKDYNIIEKSYELKEYNGNPYTFITKNGQVVAHLSGRTKDANGFREFLVKSNVIK